jgi:hypothetical protein
MRDVSYWDTGLEDFFKRPVFDEMSAKEHIKCFVVFSGLVVTQKIRSYSYDDGPLQKNVYYRLDAADIDKLWGGYDQAFQDAQDNDIIYTKVPDRQ